MRAATRRRHGVEELRDLLGGEPVHAVLHRIVTPAPGAGGAGG
ncbi:hypothetical protein RND61_30095 [Streptomyces sp. TRM76323]|uniref:Uncharacterized protein n=1 Tax=Streptomyces tamarix TaxID=3078565 RepID=A0ABU3QUA9_9ACTN|nr:hypothetical protein [Streptomyces tamarix]MDT9686289.1 hypothetical protein [Streptomyces tamarix]